MKRRTVKKQFWFSRDEAQDLQKKAKMLMKFLRLTRELIWKEKSMSRCISVQQTRQQNSARKHSMLYVMST